jgi:hypothetical protein
VRVELGPASDRGRVETVQAGRNWTRLYRVGNGLGSRSLTTTPAPTTLAPYVATLETCLTSVEDRLAANVPRRQITEMV